MWWVKTSSEQLENIDFEEIFGDVIDEVLELVEDVVEFIENVVEVVEDIEEFIEFVQDTIEFLENLEDFLGVLTQSTAEQLLLLRNRTPLPLSVETFLYH